MPDLDSSCIPKVAVRIGRTVFVNSVKCSWCELDFDSSKRLITYQNYKAVCQCHSLILNVGVCAVGENWLLISMPRLSTTTAAPACLGVLMVATRGSVTWRGTTAIISIQTSILVRPSMVVPIMLVTNFPSMISTLVS